MPVDKRTTVLLVAADPDGLSQAESYLVARGLRVITSSSLDAVGALLLRYQPAVAVLDAGVAGFELADLVDLRLPQPPVLFHSVRDKPRLHAAIQQQLVSS